MLHMLSYIPIHLHLLSGNIQDPPLELLRIGFDRWWAIPASTRRCSKPLRSHGRWCSHLDIMGILWNTVFSWGFRGIFINIPMNCSDDLMRWLIPISSTFQYFVRRLAMPYGKRCLKPLEFRVSFLYWHTHTIVLPKKSTSQIGGLQLVHAGVARNANKNQMMSPPLREGSRMFYCRAHICPRHL